MGVHPPSPGARTALLDARGGRSSGGGEGPCDLAGRRERAERALREILRARYAEAFERRGGLDGRISYGLICRDVLDLLARPRDERGPGWCGAAEYQYEVRFRARCRRWGIGID